MNGDAALLDSPQQLQPLRLSVSTSASLIGNVVYTLCQAGMVVALAHLGEPAMVGQFALGIAVAGPVMLLASLQLRTLQVTDAAQHHPFSQYLALRLTTCALALPVIAVTALLLGGSAQTVAAVLLVGAMQCLQGVTDVYRGLMQQRERMDRVAISLILRGTAALAAFTVALLWHGGLLIAVAAVITTDFLVWWSWDVRTARVLLNGQRAQPRFDAAALRTLTVTALPLGVVGMLLSLNSYGPQYAVKQFAGESDLGIFAALLYAASATRIFIAAAGQSASPRLARLHMSRDHGAFNSLHRGLLLFAALVGVLTIAGALLVGAPLLRILYGPEYAGHARLFVELALVAAVAHVVSVQGYSVTATQCFQAQLPVSALAAGTTLLGSFALVPHYGSDGAAAAMLAGILLQGAGYSILLRREQQHAAQRALGEPHAVA